MSYNHTYSQIKEILKSSPKISKPIMLQVARLAIKETLGDRVEIDSIEWDSKFIDLDADSPVSYTHLTLPTKRIV